MPLTGAQPPDPQVRFDFTNSAVLVTGGTRNLGRSFARAFASAGARVAVLGGTDRAALDETLSELGPEGHVGRLADLADPDAVTEAASWALAQLGTLDILVNNAVVRGHGALQSLEVSAWDRAMAVNVRAPFLLAQQLAPAMADRGYGRILNISGLAAHWGAPDAIQLGTSKAALDGLTRSLASATAASGVTVNSLMCGFVEGEGAVDPDRQGEVRRRVPSGRPATHAEIVDVGLFLCSRAASYVTGQTIVVAGGAVPPMP